MVGSIKVLSILIEIFKKLLKSNRPIEVKTNVNKDTIRVKSHLIKFSDDKTNKAVNNLFFLA